MGVSGTALRGDIQGLRAVAVIAVVLYHAGVLLPGGFVGVDVFFVISGYVIAASLQREWQSSGTIDLRCFYLRRIRRLLPAFAAMVGVVTLIGIVAAPLAGREITARTGLAATLFNANTYLAGQVEGYFDPTVEANALLHTWSLSVEEQFYFVFPAVLLVGWRLGRRFAPENRDLAAVALILTLAAGSWWLLQSLTAGTDIDRRWAFYLAPARAWEFIAGVVLVFAAPSLRRLPAAVANVVAGLGAVALAWSFIRIDAEMVFPGTVVIVPVIGTMALIVAGEGRGRVVFPRALELRPMQWIGDLSYGWYLWHWPAIVFAKAWFPNQSEAPLIAAIGSIAIAMASLDALEAPLRRAVARPAATLRLAAICCVAALVASGALLAVQARGSAALDELAGHVGEGVCDKGRSLDELDPSCTWGPADAAMDIVVVGDSQAGQIVEGVLTAVHARSVSVTQSSFDACPFVDLTVEHHEYRHHRDRCDTFVAGTVDELVERQPDVVVLASGSEMYLSSAPMVDRATGEPITGAVEREAAWAGGIDRVVEPLTDAGIEVVFVMQLARFDEWNPQSCAVWLLEHRPESCAVSMSVAAGLETLGGARDVEAAAVDRHDLAVVDLFSLVCADACRTHHGSWIMRDGSHISVAFSESLADDFAYAFGLERPAILRVAPDDA